MVLNEKDIILEKKTKEKNRKGVFIHRCLCIVHRSDGRKQQRASPSALFTHCSIFIFATRRFSFLFFFLLAATVASSNRACHSGEF